MTQFLINIFMFFMYSEHCLESYENQLLYIYCYAIYFLNKREKSKVLAQKDVEKPPSFVNCRDEVV